MPLIGSLFSGSGMLDEAVRSVIGGTVAWHAEYEPPTEKNPKPTQAAARLLAHRYPGVPNLGDISAIDWSAVPRVDVLTGGFPCQDVSHAGKREGLSAGTRSGLWARMCDAVDALRPRLVVIENVRGLTSACADSEMGRCPRCVGGSGPHDPVLRALGRVLGDLAELGYDAQWHGLPASDIGAPHERFRIFIIAQRRSEPVYGPYWPSAEFRSRLEALTHAASTRRGRLVPDDVANDGGSADRNGQEKSGRRSGGASVTDTNHRAGHGQRARTESRPGDCLVADTERLGCDGRTREQIGRPVGRVAAARTGEDAAADTHSDALRQQPVTERRGGGAPVAGLDREAAPDSAGRGRPDEQNRGDTRGLTVGTVADAGDRDCARRTAARVRELGRTARIMAADAETQWGKYEPAIRRWEALTRPAPAPTETGTRGGQRLSRWFDEWMMGWPDGWVTDVPGITYREAIKLCGNGVVPQQAAHALRLLLAIERAA